MYHTKHPGHDRPGTTSAVKVTEAAKPHVSAVTISVQALLDERYALHTSTLQQPAGSGLWTGNFRGSRRGHGTDFDDLRHYSPGDEIRNIDWNASARTNTLHTRLYREEREHRVTLIADLRSTMFTGTQELRSVKACLLTARLLWQAIDGGSRSSVIIICDTGISASEYGNGHRAAINACGLLARRFQHAQQKIDTPGRSASLHDSRFESDQAQLSGTTGYDNANMNTALNQSNSATPDDVLITIPTYPSDSAVTQVTCEQVAHWLITQRQLHGTVIWISAFDQLGEGFDEAMNSLSRASRQIAIHVHDDMLEHGLPVGRYGYLSGDLLDRARHAVTLNRTQCNRLQKMLLKQKQERIARFTDLQIPLLSTDSDNAGIVSTLRQSGHLP